jgi:hypothetical protein
MPNYILLHFLNRIVCFRPYKSLKLTCYPIFDNEATCNKIFCILMPHKNLNSISIIAGQLDNLQVYEDTNN